MSNRIPRRLPSEFDRIFKSERTAVQGHLARLTGDRSLAEDLAQETFSRLYQRTQTDDEPLHNPRAWLLSVASNLAYNHFRLETRRGAREVAAHAAPPDHPDIDTGLDVRRVLGQLAPRDRMSLLLRHSGFSYAEIAEATGVATSSVGTILARAQRRFRDIYEGAGSAGDEE